MDRNNKTAWEGVALIVLSILVIILIEHCARTREAEAHTGHDHIPPISEQYRRTLTMEVRYYMGMKEPVSRLAGQVHAESGWRAGVCSRFACGIGQQTERTARSLARMYPTDLEGRAAPLDPRWGIRAMVLLMKQIRSLLTPFGPDAHAATLAAYNMGETWLARERKATVLAGGNQWRWFGHVEDSCVRATSACEESRAYPRKILFRWWPLYQKAGW